MAPKSALSSLLLLPLALPAVAFDPSCAPGGNFDLSPWSLQLPTGSSFTTIKSSALQGCDGYTDSNFYTDATTGAIVFTAPGNPSLTGCVTSSGSEHCRTEMREVVPSTGSNAAWSPSGTNTLSVTMTVVSADDGSHGTAIGQVFASAASKPLLEMYYSQAGVIVAGVKPNADGNQVITQVGTVPVGTEFDYKLDYSNDVLTVTINGDVTTLDTGTWGSPDCYFKAGDYNQAKTDVSSVVQISAIEVSHS